MIDPAFPASRRLRSFSVRPQKVLAPRALRLSDFYEEVGQAAFGSAWVAATRPLRPSTKRASLTPCDEQAALVADDLSYALQSGTIQTAIRLDLPAPEIEQPVESDSLLDDLDDNRQYTAADEAPSRRLLTQYIIETCFWDSTWLEAIDWQSSQIHVPVRLIRASSSPQSIENINAAHPLITYRPDLKYRADQLLSGPILVLSADAALSAMLSIDAIPAVDFNNRYMYFRNRLIDELIAAAWRWLAINRGHEITVGTSELVEAMSSYLDLQCIDGLANKISEKGLEAIARQILNERQGRNCSSIVLKNTRSVRPFKAAVNP